ncbi:hypothetical protein BDZ94DRAFT_1363706 [Collybia nuda]|uniref:Chromatin elongation factor SPT5 n=1 Tax=Collybia nuda TaxID=64659 RepID=A0A9P6C7V8_9AGAR|nr:hypothetical protein BDZ94DRAFT_1363706 [Collybia nuda]
MPPRYTALSRFIDLEADVDDSEDEEESSDDDQRNLDKDTSDDNRNDFVVADEPIDKGTLPVPNWLRWEDIDQWEDQESPEFLAKLAQDVVERHRRSGLPRWGDDDGNSSNIPFATAEDNLFRVRVKPGLERDIVLAIIQKVLDSTDTHPVLSVFCRDSIKGSVYVEAESITAVQNVLYGIYGIVRLKGTQGEYAASSVDVLDRHLLLDMTLAGASLPVKADSWARIKRGKYRRDLALIKSVNPATSICSALVIPRINMGKKRKRGFRVPQSLFDPATVQAAFGAKAAVMLKPMVWKFKSQLYEFGCLNQKIHLINLSIEGINATPQELEPFRQCGECWERAMVDISPIKVGDRVQIISGPFMGLVGEIVEVLSMTVRVCRGKGQDQWERKEGTDQDEGDTREVLTRDLRRLFEAGDVVQVIHGHHRGLDGFVVHLEDSLATVYILPSKDEFSPDKDGKELILKTVDLTWKSNASNFLENPPTAFPVISGRTAYDPAHPMGVPYVAPDPGLELGKRVVDRYRHMEVKIIKGDLKRHFGSIIGTYKSKDGEDLFQVRTSTRATNTVNTYHVNDLRERFTKLAIDRACWIPARFRNARTFVEVAPHIDRPLTPLPSPGSSSVRDPLAPSIETGSSLEVTIPGEWLFDERLLMKKLDVRVQGTTSTYPSWQSGRFEGQLGWVVLTNKIRSGHTSTYVKVGFAESRALLQIQHLVPERTTEVPTYWPTITAPTSIFSSPGTRVVVLGPDENGCTDYIGNYALVTQSPVELPNNFGLVQIASPGPNFGKYIYLDISSVCRSIPTPGPIDWFGLIIY